MRRPHTALAVAGLAVVLIGGCASEQRVDIPDAGSIDAPAFRAIPDEAADQLDAIVERNTADLEPTSDSANGELLAPALAALAAIDNPPDELTRLTIYDDYVLFGFYEDGITGRSVSGYYENEEDGVELSTPSFSEQEAYPIAAIDPAVPQRLIDTIESRYPQARVTSVDLDVGLSYDFGLAWYLDLEDAQGGLATIWADLDGAVIAVDQS